jgi:hypothetical protein
VHDFFKRNFKFLVTDTVEHSDGIQKCIRVRLGSGPRGGRGRNRRRWMVQVGEMTSRLTVEALHPGLITWGSFLGDSIFFVYLHLFFYEILSGVSIHFIV